ncbi:MULTISPECIES: vitamin K epoxide reductase family protein [unclassified Corynebacterium]|uniref:vitamin K epoxide reductase family protein n=1 Tax=unclassified Corynebacterium TaxID=2624378 RepID=UPI0029CA7FBB|nr:MULTISPECIES: vitamin K epoxide reductase family protein [unclassified Corynebacterium]WPF66533.1 vitamin K epoxide reductase family protein [Corynebacterium sp. 22KM0430]WPF69022.1 vitamin K epoxide reductase family protein [Corynebacterium sp. 21KM1197]
MVDAQASTTAEENRGAAPSVGWGWLFVLGGIIGIVLSGIIMVEKMKLAEDPSYTTTCDLSAVVSCGNVMRSVQAAAFGIPNPLIGLVGFGMVALIGAAVAAGGRFAGWFWFGAQAGMTFALVFVHWLFFQAVYVINALCPYCMGVWAVVIVLFVYVTAFNLRTYGDSGQGAGSAAIRAWDRWKFLIAAAWIAVIGVAILVEFWSYF